MEQLIEAYKQKNVILFIGAGVSKGLGLPSWNDLINTIATELDYDPDIYSTFGDHLALAEYYRIKQGGLGKLRSWMDRNWHSDTIKIEDSDIHKIIVNANFPLIYTTNYDRWIENAFDKYGKKYHKIVNVSDLIKTDNDTTQIVKFHGDFDDDNSIVLDETSYFKRLEFETPLDIKLRSDILGKTVLFIGYSLSDINIRLLFFKLSQLWKENAQGNAQPTSYVFSARPNPVQEEILKQWRISMISSDIDDSSKALIEFMRKLTSK
ncbi:SIR2 family protein [Aliarcobacter butzleri]|uniref:SIR2 family NAD-dependent protein deacylase n=1 Tax=Aliarcobacter butzleri TaxID=28197 RepID=UPI001EDD0A27|nr:SIR2 family protein [Aliarcobacter butzleri]MCG3703808.1 SIR2 family protein [Aliarcobacter butzleri]